MSRPRFVCECGRVVLAPGYGNLPVMLLRCLRCYGWTPRMLARLARQARS